MDTTLSVLDMLANTDLNTVDTSFPILAPGTYEFEVKEAEIKTSDNGVRYAAIKTALVSPDAKDTNGNPINAGYPVRHMFMLSVSEKQVAKHGEEQAKKNVIADVCRFMDAVQGNRNWDETLQSYIGQRFFAKTKVSKERTDEATGQTYSPQAEFAQLLPKAS